MKLPIEEHKMKYPNLDRNAYLGLFGVLLIVTVALLVGECYRAPSKVNRQIQLHEVQRFEERIALENGHAVEVRP